MKLKYSTFFFLTFLSSHLWSNPWSGADALATGNGGVAVTHESEFGVFNPASIAFKQGYSLRLTGNSAQEGRLSFVDHMPDTLVPSALIISENRQDRELESRYFVLNFGQNRTPSQAWGVGLAYRYFLDGRPAQAMARLGVLHFIKSHFSLGANWEADRAQVGVAYIFSDVIRLRADVAYDPQLATSTRWILGAESFMNKWLILKGGYFLNAQQQVQGTWGLAFSGPRLKVHYAQTRSESGGAVGEILHWLDFTLPLW